MTTRILVIPGGTAIGSVALAHAGLHKIVELHEERLQDPNHPAPHTVVVMRDPAEVAPSTLRTSALDAGEVFPEYADEIAVCEDFFDGIDLIIETSGSTTGVPQRVGLSIEALLASIDATHEFFDGPGAWILALPAHHIAGAMALLRSTRHDFPPRIVDTSAGFDPQTLIPAVRGALSHGGAGYLAIVPAQLRKILDDPQAREAVASLNAVLVGGQHIPEALLDEAREAGVKVHTSYGMTETCGGVVYDGYPLAGVGVRLMAMDGKTPAEPGEAGRIAISSPTLMTRYLSGEEPWVEMAGVRWLVTNDWGSLSEDGRLSVLGRIDDVVISGGEKVLPAQVEEVMRAYPGVADVCVVGRDDKRWGSVVAALVVHADGTEAVTSQWAQGLYEYVRSVGNRAWAPRVIAPICELPLKASGKVDRRWSADLIDQVLLQGRGWERVASQEGSV